MLQDEHYSINKPYRPKGSLSLDMEAIKKKSKQEAVAETPVN